MLRLKAVNGKSQLLKTYYQKIRDLVASTTKQSRVLGSRAPFPYPPPAHGNSPLSVVLPSEFEIFI